MKKWSSLLMIAIFALLTPLLSPNVSAEEMPGISITKIADKTSAAVGDTIIYTYTIINTGSIVTDNITLNDDMLGSIALDTTILAPSENVTATADYTVLETDLPGPLKNTAKITGTADGITVTDNASASVPLTYSASIEVIKTAFPTLASLNDTITYTFQITNTGNVTTDNITLEDNKLWGGTLRNIGSLDPGDSITVSDNYTVAISDTSGAIINVATVKGHDPLGNTVTDSDSASVGLYPRDPGTRTMGFYKNHPCVINQVLPITITGDNVTTAEEVISIIQDRSSHRSRLKSQLTVTILNVAVFGIGNCTMEHLGLEGNETVQEIISQAEALLAADPPAGKDELSSMQDILDSINNSNTSAPLPEDISEACPPGGGPPNDPNKKGKNPDAGPNNEANTMTKADILKERGVPGKGIDEAPGLKKTFNNKSRAGYTNGAGYLKPKKTK